jgi:hypothetical protein
MKNPLPYQIIDRKPLNAENAPKLRILKNPLKHECARVDK